MQTLSVNFRGQHWLRKEAADKMQLRATTHLRKTRLVHPDRPTCSLFSKISAHVEYQVCLPSSPRRTRSSGDSHVKAIVRRQLRADVDILPFDREAVRWSRLSRRQWYTGFRGVPRQPICNRNEGTGKKKRALLHRLSSVKTIGLAARCILLFTFQEKILK